MAAFSSSSSSRYLLAFFLLNLYLKVMDADPNLTFYYKNFGKDSSFESHLALFGDAKVARDNFSVQISGSGASAAGRFVSKKPFNLVHGKSRNPVSFSNYFAFSMSGGNGDGLAFVMLPRKFPLNAFDGGEMGLLGERKVKFLAVEFDTFRNEKHGDLNGNHVGMDVDSPVSVKVSNVSSINLVLNSGVKLQSWVDYEASSKRFEIRLNKFGEEKPITPILTYPIDLSRMWGDEDVVVGFSSSSRNSSQKCIVYSWSFKSRSMPQWMHSEPLDPQHFVGKEDEMKVRKRNDCTLRILSALVFGTGCGALGAFIVLFLWTILGDRRPIVPEEFVEQPKELEYKKFEVSVEKKTIEDGKVLGA